MRFYYRDDFHCKSGIFTYGFPYFIFTQNPDREFWVLTDNGQTFGAWTLLCEKITKISL